MNATGDTSGGGELESSMSLPVLGIDGKSVRRSRNARRRAWVLVCVHVLLLLHVVHYLWSGWTLSPVEPSESMFALELGQINAGAIFFAVALLSTLVFGRFFCGWGCHLVAYQDLCGWLMKKIGVRPKAFRSRFLMYVPLGLALYMFVWPAAKRALFAIPTFERWVSNSPGQLGFVFGRPPGAFPTLSNHLTTTTFWATFPGPVFAILTILVCGFGAVYILGAKGFCTYGCPYGGFFGVSDHLAIGKILVSDACAGCGHCTAVCTSNVRVHEEVRRYGMVVDPGCMKCLDCVSVCPNGALSFGFSPVSARKIGLRGAAASTRFDVSMWEEVFLVVVFLGTTMAMRGLYDGPPLLMSVGLGGITAFVMLKLVLLFRRPTVRIQNLRLKAAGRWRTAGVACSVVSLVWLAFVVHSGYVQWHRTCGRYWLSLTEAGEEAFAPGGVASSSYSPIHDRAVTNGLDHLSKADRWGLLAVPEVKSGLAWFRLCRGEDDLAVDRLREAIALSPESASIYEQLTAVLVKQRRIGEAIDAMRALFTVRTPTAAEHFRLGVFLSSEQRGDEAMNEFERCLELSPDAVECHYNLGGLLGRAGRFDEAAEHLREAVRLSPRDVDACIELAVVCVGQGNTAEAIRLLRQAETMAPNDPRAGRQLDALLQSLGQRR